MKRRFKCFSPANGAAESGLSLIESSIVFMFALSILFGAFGVVDFVYLRIRVADQVDKFTTDQGIRPYRISDGGNLLLDEDSIRSSLAGVAAEFETDFQNRFRAAATEYFLEVDYAVLPIDTETGAVLDVIVAPGTAITKGALAVPEDVMSKTDLLAEFQSVAGPIGVRSPFAVPTALMGRTGAPQFAPGVVLVGVRAVYSFKGSLASWVLSLLQFGEHPLVADYKVFPVRAEVEAEL